MRGVVGLVQALLPLVLAAACSSSSAVKTPPAGTGSNAGVGASAGVGGSAGRGGKAGTGGTAGTLDPGEGGDSGEGAQGGTSPGGRAGAGGSDAGQSGAAGDGGDDPCTNGGILEGDIDARGDLEVLRCVVELRGNLWIHLGPELPASVPELERVTGALTLEGRGARRVEEDQPFSLPALESVGSLSVTDWSGAPNLSLPALTHVRGDVRLESSVELETVGGALWPELRTIDRDLLIGACRVIGGFEDETVVCSANASLVSVELPALERVQNVVVGDNPALDALRAPALVSAADLLVGHCLPITNDDLDYFEEDYCKGPTRLHELSLPKLRSADNVRIRFGLIEALALPALETVSDFEFQSTWGLDLPLDLSSLRRASLLLLEDLGAGVTVPALVTAMEINLTGTMSDPLSFPALTGVRRLYVSASGLTGFDCATVLPAMAADAFPNLQLSGASIASFDCSGVVEFRSLSLTGTSVAVVSLSALTSTSSLDLSGDELTSVQAPALSSGSVRVSYAPKLGALVLSALEQSDVLTLGITGLTSLELPALRRAGDVNLLGTGAASLAFPVLEEVKQLNVANESAAELSLPSLAAGALQIMDNPGLTRIDLPAFAHLGASTWFGWDAVTIRKNPILSEIILGLSGESDQKVTLVKNPELSLLVLGAPTSLRALTLEKNRKLDYVDLPVSAIGELELTNGTVVMPLGASAFSVGVYEHDGFDQAPDVWAPHSVTVRGLTIVEEGIGAANTEALTSISFPDVVSAKHVGGHTNAALTTVDFPALGPSIVSLSFENNAVLTRPVMPVLTSVGNFYVNANVSWSQCDVEAWAASLGATCSCEDNGACSP